MVDQNAHAKAYSRGAYWAKRSDLMYYQYLDYMMRTVARDATSLIDVGTGNSPYLEWFYWIDRKVSVDIANPYQSETVEGIEGNLLEMELTERFDFCTCLQVLEHVPEPKAFAHRLFDIAENVIISVPLKSSFFTTTSSLRGGIGNPLGLKVSDKCTPEELIKIIDTMNPQNIPGRLSIVVRMGAEKLRKNLPGLIRAVQREGKSVLWISDPVHGNTRKTENGFKTRDFDKIRDELRAFFDVHDEMGSHPGGVHIEMTGEDVTECVGGLSNVSEKSLGDRYHTYCDPRLNGAQALELAFLIAERMRVRTGLPPIE